MVYRTGFSWKLAELAPRGAQVKTLTNNFRNTAEIQRAATTMLSASPASVDEDSRTPTDVIPRLARYPPFSYVLGGRWSIVRFVVVSRSRSLPVFRRQNIAILAGTKQTLGEWAEALKSVGVPVEPFRPRARVSVRIADRTVKLLTMHSAKGLDFPHVYLVDLTARGIPPTLTAGAPNEETLELQRRLVYTSMCRAGQTLTMTTLLGEEHPLLDALGNEVYLPEQIGMAQQE